MRLDKLTTKLQEALADAQSQAVGNDNQYIEPVHLLLALLNQDRIHGPSTGRGRPQAPASAPFPTSCAAFCKSGMRGCPP